MLNTNEQNTLTYSTTDDNGSAIYNLEGNDTYDFNGFHVWNRTYQNGLTSKAHYYVDSVEYKGRWKFWQHTDVGKLPGIKGHVDFNIYNGSYYDLRQMTIGSMETIGEKAYKE